MMDLGVLAIDPTTLKVLSIDEVEASKKQKLVLHREHGLNKNYLQFHLDNIYIKDHGLNEIQLSSANQEL
jgi:hypothetical protein